MLKKNFSKNGKSCRVTFKLPADLGAEQGAVLGEFNEWQPEANPLTKRKDGSLSTTISLEAGREYRFRYLLDDTTWQNDDNADELVPNRFGSKDCVIAL